jgi:formylmethanofuran dehydrogenase subunit E
MNEMECITIPCCHCGKKFSEDDIYIFEGKHMCDDCAMKVGLFPR